jgi:outer membrane protein TolC
MTRKIVHIITVLAVLILPAKAFSSQDIILERLLSLASEKNPAILAARERINQAKADVKTASAQLGPSLTTEITERFGRDTPSQAREAYSASLNLVQTVYAGNTLQARKKAAELALSATASEAERTYQDVLNSVRTDYYSVLRASAQLKVAHESRDMSKEHLAQAEALFKAGMVPRGDVLRVKVSVSQAEQDRVRAENDLDVGLSALEHSVGVPVLKEEILEEVNDSGIETIRPPEFAVSGDVVSRALSLRPEISAYEFYLKRAGELILAAEGERLPSVSLSGGVRASGSNYVTDEDEWFAQIALQWTIFDGGQRASQAENLKSAAKELVYRMDGLNDQIRQETIQAKLNLTSAEARYEIAKSQLNDAQEDYRLAMRRYDAQVGTNLDVLDSRAALTESLTSYVNSVYDIAAAQSGLIYAIGEDTAVEIKNSK